MNPQPIRTRPAGGASTEPFAPGQAATSGETGPPVSAVPPGEVYDLLDTRPEGLSAAAARIRLDRDGPNVIRQTPGVPLWRRLLANFTHLMALLLWIGGAIAFAAGLPQLGTAIVLVNIVNGLFSFWQEHRADKATEALRRLLPSLAGVVRDGTEERVAAENLVVGDVILLVEGDRISADARLVEEVELRVDQSTLTGEAHPVRKATVGLPDAEPGVPDVPNLVYAGTNVASGRGRAVVFAIGMDTRFGEIAGLTQGTRQEQSPLQRELSRLSVVVGIVAVSVGLLFFALAQLLTPMDLALGFVFTLGMIVAFVPEGLLPTVTLALAMGTQRMARRNALVKRLSAVEALGSTTVICTDKTGTLTQNEMTVRSIFLPGRQIEVTGTGYAPEGTLRRDGEAIATPVEGDLRGLLLAAGLANNARLVAPQAEGERHRIRGDPTEGALKVVAAKAGLNLELEAAAAPRAAEAPFESSRKRMSTLHTIGPARTLYTKGAPRELLACCTCVRVAGQDVPLDDRWRTEIEHANDAFSREALRVLAVATRTVPQDAVPRRIADLETDLTFLGLVGMLDPPHPEVAQAVATCHRAGIRILMMTGDYGITAESIARRIGLASGPLRIVNGDELDAADDATLAGMLAQEVLFARSTPEHKLRVVRVLQDAGQVVAVTGDGVNDAPALKRADIGIAMGLIGTDVAKEAADMVLLDDNFASIVAAVEEGRAVYANIKKFTGYIFTSNTPEAVPFIVFAFSGGQIPLALGVMHILAIDLGTDLLPALALGSERPEPGVMRRPPRKREEHLVTRGLLARSYGLLGPLQALAVMGVFFFTYWQAGFTSWLDLPGSGLLYRSATAMALAAVVATQVGNLFAHRAEHSSIMQVGWATNRLAFVGIASEAVIIAAIVYLPVLQVVIGTAPFPAANWLLLLALTPLLLVVDEARKLLRARQDRSRS